jgi:hypothetical protein
MLLLGEQNQKALRKWVDKNQTLIADGEKQGKKNNKERDA